MPVKNDTVQIDVDADMNRFGIDHVSYEAALVGEYYDQQASYIEFFKNVPPVGEWMMIHQHYWQ